MTEHTVHPAAAFWPMLNNHDLAELARDIKDRGLQVPILLFEGAILDGRNRLAACNLADVFPRFEEYTGTDPFGQVLSLNEARRHLPSSQRTAIVSLIMKARNGWEEERDAKANEVRSAKAKERPRSKQDDGSTRFEPSGVSADTPLGNDTPKSKGTRVELAALAQASPATAARVLALPEPLVREVAAGKLTIPDATAIKGMPEETKAAIAAEVEAGSTFKQAIKAHVAHNSGNNEWYTPPEYISAAMEVMGGIDLDPASCELANETVKAEKFYSEEEDGLAHEWAGRVWMNPPYASGLIDKFCSKLAESRVDAAIVLVNNATETKWTSSLASVASAVCFPTARIRFVGPDGAKGAPLQGQAVYYVGAEVDAFCRVFARFGWVAVIRRCDV